MLGLVILILLIVLLVPLRLNVKARYDEEVRARVHVSWLLHAVHVKFEWLKDHGLLRAKLLGLKTLVKKHIGDWGPELPEAEEESVPAEPGEEPASSDAPESSEAKPESSEAKPESSAEKPDASEEKPAAAEKKPASAPKAEEEKAEEAPAAAETAAEQTAEAKAKEEDLPRLAAINEKLDSIAGKLDEFQGYWYDEKNRKTMRLVGKQLKKIGRHLKPTHFLLEGELGLSDPAKTGKIMGTLYSFYPIFRDNVRIQGNYDEKIVKLRLELKGRLRLGIFIEVALRLLLDKNLRHWIKKLTHKDKDQKGTEESTEVTAEAADQEQKAA